MQNTDRRKKKYVYILPKNSYHKQKLLYKITRKDVRIGLYYKNRDRFEKEKRRK